MLGAYGAVLRAPGALAFSAAGLVGRFPIAMLGIGIVLLVEGATGSYAVAGGIAASYIVATSVGSPVQARLADRVGQRLVLVPTCLAHAAALGVLLLLAATDRPTWTLAAAAVAVGLSMPQIGAMVRARWSALPPEQVRLHTAYALESVNDEVVFVLGPVLVTTLATAVDQSAGLALAAVLTLVGGLALAAQRATEPPAMRTGSVGGGPRPALPLGTVVPMTATFVCLGALFGTFEVATVAFADERGRPVLAGPLLAVYAVGSLVAGIVYGTLRTPADPDRRYALCIGLLSAAFLPLPFVGSPWVLAALLAVGGLAIAPTLITGNLLLSDAVPGARLTEALAWSSTGLTAGVGIGSSLAGAAVDAAGASAAYWIAVASGALGTALAAARLAQPRRARP